MIKNNDWRLTNQMNYLYRKQLLHIPFTPYRKGWEHEHCSFCSGKIDNDTKKAYCTTDKYHWICERCFKDFNKIFEWDIKEEAEKNKNM
ncbi:MAG: hypothetical protein FWF92_02505 [Oscillospiraceae bacterium]|nr:hypothetical protein [Oscillospiraceae bacterium]